MSNCFKVSNNKFFNCPALMSDGRAFTDYRSSCYINTNLLNKNDFNSSYQYRQWLIHNAVKLMNNNNAYNNRLNGCAPCNADPVPLQGVCVNNGYVPKCRATDDDGLGLGYVAGNIPQLDYAPALQKIHYNSEVNLSNASNSNNVPYRGVPNHMCGSR
tara:strand:- start:1627 stop:2100 length:474 start_codon:yes stop_codon:yes gene_type:complete